MSDVRKYPLTMPGDLYRRSQEAAGRQGERLSTWMRAAIREKLEREAIWRRAWEADPVTEAGRDDG